MATTTQRLQLHSSLLATTHAFFQARDVREVMTPCVVVKASSEPGIESFGIDSQSRWLRDSPEYEMKRLLMTVEADIYQVAPVFRKGEYGTKHRPEFILLEWYRRGWDYRRLMEECLDYIQTAVACRDTKRCFLSYRQLFENYFGCDPMDGDNISLSAAAAKLGYHSELQSRAECLDFLFEYATTRCSTVEHPNTLVAVYDFPIEQASFAKLAAHRCAERFEIFLNGIELANGYSELTCVAEYEERIQLHNKVRNASSYVPLSIDEDFMQTLKKYGLAACAGVSVGIERLLMCKAHSHDIGQIVLL